MRQNDEHILENEYNKSLGIAKNHYENFPIVSMFLPKKLRKHVATIYRFARTADDFADEGDISPSDRLKLLADYEEKFSKCMNNEFSDLFFETLKNTIDTFNLSSENFTKLLSAFRQDVSNSRFENFDEIINYCSRSADPVGRIMLELSDNRNSDAIYYSDKICSALQLTNFYQDITIDTKKNRIYIPLEELISFGLSENDFKMNSNQAKIKELIKFQVERAFEMFAEGRQILPMLKGLFRLQISAIISGGETILNSIRNIDYESFRSRPKLTKVDYIRILIKVI